MARVRVVLNRPESASNVGRGRPGHLEHRAFRARPRAALRFSDRRSLAHGMALGGRARADSRLRKPRGGSRERGVRRGLRRTRRQEGRADHAEADGSGDRVARRERRGGHRLRLRVPRPDRGRARPLPETGPDSLSPEPALSQPGAGGNGRRVRDLSSPLGRLPRREAPQRATAGEAERALGAFREALLEIGFLPADHPESRFVEWRELFGRAGLTPRETRVLLALARRIQNVGRLAKTREASPEREASD